MSKVKILVLMLLLSSVIGSAACSHGASIEDTAWVMESYGEKENLKGLIADTEINV